MSVSHRFISSDGLIPCTIFDKGDADMDISEEMEEVRELLYELIKKNFPRGVTADHLAKVYKDEYVSARLGPDLPANWLEQVKAAEEFEAQSRGPLTILFIRLHNSPSLKKGIVPPSNVPPPLVSVGLDSTASSHSPLQLAQMLRVSAIEEATIPCDVTVVAFTSIEDFHIRLDESQRDFAALKKQMKEVYTNGGTPVAPNDVCINGAYALKDADGDYFRVIVISPSKMGMVQCLFVDVGVVGSFNASSLLHLSLATVNLCRGLATRVALEDVGGSRPSVDSSLKQLLFTPEGPSLIPVPLKLQSLSAHPCSSSGARAVSLAMADGRDLRATLMDSLAASKENTAYPATQKDIPAYSFGPLVEFNKRAELEPLDPGQMPRRPFLAHAIYASGPAEISMRQATFEPMPDYLYDRLAEESSQAEAALTSPPVVGEFYASAVDGVWQRVQCVRGSKIDPSTFLVYLVDVGAFHYAQAAALRRLNFFCPVKKMLTFKCKLFGVSPMGGVEVWSREAQIAVNEFFQRAQEQPVEVIPRSEWTAWKQLNAPLLPFVEASIRREGRDLADWLCLGRLAQPSL